MDANAKASRAASILEDLVFIEAISVVKGYHVDVFLEHSSTPEEIMEAHRAVRSLTLVQGQLQSFVDDGRLLERKQKDRQRGQHA